MVKERRLEMNIILGHGRRSGEMIVPSSKSHTLRLLICATLTEQMNEIVCPGSCDDIDAAVSCLKALGSDITQEDEGVITVGRFEPGNEAVLNCGESGSALRFFLPLACALGVNTRLYMRGKLPSRPILPLCDALTQNGAEILRYDDYISCRGKLQSGDYILPGNVSSQFISSLLMALPLLEGDSIITVTGRIESAGYIAMTEESLRLSGISFLKEENRYIIPGNQRYSLPKLVRAEPDISAAAFPLCIGALSERGVTVRGIGEKTTQPDGEIISILTAFGALVSFDGNDITVSKGSFSHFKMDASRTPDLVPPLCALAAAAGCDFTAYNCERLSLKESDRISSCIDTINSLGGVAYREDNSIVVKGKIPLPGGIVSSCRDHRIAMMAAVISCGCAGDVIITDGECVAKSYPDFWEQFKKLEEE